MTEAKINSSVLAAFFGFKKKPKVTQSEPKLLRDPRGKQTTLAFLENLSLGGWARRDNWREEATTFGIAAKRIAEIEAYIVFKDKCMSYASNGETEDVEWIADWLEQRYDFLLEKPGDYSSYMRCLMGKAPSPLFLLSVKDTLAHFSKNTARSPVEKLCHAWSRKMVEIDHANQLRLRINRALAHREKYPLTHYDFAKKPRKHPLPAAIVEKFLEGIKTKGLSAFYQFLTEARCHLIRINNTNSEKLIIKAHNRKITVLNRQSKQPKLNTKLFKMLELTSKTEKVQHLSNQKTDNT